MSVTYDVLSKLADFNIKNKGTFYPELTKIKLLIFKAKKNSVNTVVYTYTSPVAGYFVSILFELQKIFHNMFIYYTPNSSYQLLSFNSVLYSSATNSFSDSFGSSNTLFISQTELTIPNTGQLVFSYTGTTAPTLTNDEIPFINAPNVSISSRSATVSSNIVTITINISYTLPITTSNDYGLSFKNTSGFYNNFTNLNITTLNNIPLSKTGSQFAFLQNLSIIPGQNPIIRISTMLNLCFQDCINFNSNINAWDASNVINMSGVFLGAVKFNNGNPPNSSGGSFNWNTTNVTNMSSMFRWSAFNCDIITFNTSKVTNMEYMFEATKFNQQISANGEYWNMLKVTNISYMFNAATNFNNGDVSGGTSKPLNWSFSTTTLSFTNWHYNSALTRENAFCLQYGPTF